MAIGRTSSKLRDDGGRGERFENTRGRVISRKIRMSMTRSVDWEAFEAERVVRGELSGRNNYF